MFQRVLVPLDLSGRNARALETAAELADPASVLVLQHVIAEVEGVEPGELEEFYAGLRARAAQVLEGHARALRERGRESRIEIGVGRRGPEILRLAELEGSDLIVLSSHALEPDRPGGGIGTLSHHIALLAPCAVLLVR